MSDFSIQIAFSNDQPVIDSRIVADLLCIEHETLVRTIRKYENKFNDISKLRVENKALEIPDRGTREVFSHYLLTISNPSLAYGDGLFCDL